MKLLVISLLVFVFTSCVNTYIKPGSPVCLKQIIRDQDAISCSGAEIKEYEFQNELVYVYDNGCVSSDGSTPVFDSNCDHIGYLGGMTGNRKIKGEEFSNAIYKRTIWTKD